MSESQGSATPKENADKAVIKSVDMSEEMQDAVINIAIDAFSRFTIEKDIAADLKKELDRRFGIAWHVIVGKNFGSYVTHESKHFIYFYVGSLAFLVFKTA